MFVEFLSQIVSVVREDEFRSNLDHVLVPTGFGRVRHISGILTESDEARVAGQSNRRTNWEDRTQLDLLLLTARARRRVWIFRCVIDGENGVSESFQSCGAVDMITANTEAFVPIAR